MSKSLYIDFEFSRITEPKLNLICACTYDPTTNISKRFWLHAESGNSGPEKLNKYLYNFDTLIAYSAIAEARSLLTMGRDPLYFKWIDLFLEYRCLTNHSDELQWGEQLVEGKVRTVKKPRPKWEREEGEEVNGFKATHSLAEATFKLLGIIRDTEHKTKMRDLIISDPPKFSPVEQASIVEYCMEDVVSLPAMFHKMKEKFLERDKELTEEQYLEEAFTRGRFAAHTAIMENRGYPIDVEKTKNFSSQVGNILHDCQRQINEYFPEIKPFRWNKPEQRMSWKQNATREWIKKNHPEKKWMLTDKKSLSLSLEAWEKFFDFKHDYPTDNFGAQIVRYLKLKQSLYGFVPSTKGGKKTFWDSVGSDGRVRPYTNIYGAQSSRSQPGSTGFLFLKPAWMRALCVPPKGYAMGGIDYGSEEYFISAILSEDTKMIDSYLSGDVYLAFAKLAGMVPQDGTKETHMKERNICKNTVLGISYLMSKYGLAIKLTNDTGREWTEDEAEELLEMFYEAYKNLATFQEWVREVYAFDKFWKLPCGWYMYGNNENFRSVTNVPVQGMGASILRKAVDLAVARGLYVAFTLHDALYIEYPLGEEHQMGILRDCMREAFMFYFENDKQEIAAKIKLDPFAWSPEYPKDGILISGDMEIPCSDVYLDERSERDYNHFSKYFESPVTDLI